MKIIKQRRKGSPKEIQRAIRHIAKVAFRNREEDEKPNFQWHDCVASDDGLIVRIMLEYHVDLYHSILDRHHVGVPWDGMADWVAEVRATRAADGRTFLTVTVSNGDDPTLDGLWEIIESIDSELSKMGFVKDRKKADRTIEFSAQATVQPPESLSSNEAYPIAPIHTITPLIPQSAQCGASDLVEPNTDDASNERSENREKSSAPIADETEKVPATESKGQREREKPWELIPDHNWDRMAVKLLHEGNTNWKIGHRIGISEKRVANRLSELRGDYPKLVPTRNQLRERERDRARAKRQLG